MKKLIVSLLLFVLYMPSAFSQDLGKIAAQYAPQKRIESNWGESDHTDNLNGKSPNEKLFFGNFNSPVEFFYSSRSEYGEETFGLRIVKDASDNYTLDVKYITNLEKVNSMMDEKYPIPPFISHEEVMAIVDKRSRESIEQYKVQTLSFPVLQILGERLYDKMVMLIDTFTADEPQAIDTDDGYAVTFEINTGGASAVTFRTVVYDEVWSLSMISPEGDALQMSNLCRQIFEDALDGKLKKQSYGWKYIRMLQAIGFQK